MTPSVSFFDNPFDTSQSYHKDISMASSWYILETLKFEGFSYTFECFVSWKLPKDMERFLSLLCKIKSMGFLASLWVSVGKPNFRKRCAQMPDSLQYLQIFNTFSFFIPLSMHFRILSLADSNPK